MRPSTVAAIAILLLTGGQAAAQPSAPLPSPDFMFGRPKGSVGIRTGWTFARAGSDWYDFVTSTLTLADKDFNSGTVGAELAVTLTNRLDLVVGVDYSRSKVGSEYRNFVDNRRLPILQTTRLDGINLSGGLKFSLTERGRSVSRFAWVPRKLVPYVGGGGGILRFEMQQFGDFVDFVDLSVFPDRFLSTGVTPTAHMFAGADLRIWRNVYATFDVRHLWAAGQLGRDWVDFDPVDLTGTRLATGLNLAF